MRSLLRFKALAEGARVSFDEEEGTKGTCG
jgi:cold shock CspA family protein